MKAIVKRRVEDKLYQNRYLVDPGRPHISVRKHLFPTPNLIALTQVCPAKCYQLNDRRQVIIVSDGCLECGTCKAPIRSSANKPKAAEIGSGAHADGTDGTARRLFATDTIRLRSLVCFGALISSGLSNKHSERLVKLIVWITIIYSVDRECVLRAWI